MAKIWNNPITDNTDWGGDSSTNNLPVSGEQVQAWIKQRLSNVKTDVQLEDFITGILEEKGIAVDGGFVTIKTEQSIEGAKDFVGGIKVSGAPIQYDAAKNAWVFAGNMIVTRGLAVNTSIDDFDKVSVFEDIPIDMETIKWEDGKLVAVGGGSGSGGIDEDQLKDYLDKEKYATQPWINGQNYATQQWVEDQGYLTEASIEIPDGYYLPIDGTAEAAKKLATSRKIWGQSFDGSGDITGAATVTTGEGYRVQYNGYDLRFIISEKSANRGIWDNNNNRWVFGLTSGTNVYLPSGNVGVGVDMGGTVSAKLHVNGNAFVSGQFAHALTSDIRLKQNVRKFDVREYLETLGGAFVFEYIDEEVERDAFYAGTHVGFIYQNIKESRLKGMCIEREDGFGALNYFHSDYLGLLGAAAVEHEDRIQTLERQIAVMQKELKQLKSA